MPARLHPGVYVEEVPSGARAVEAAGTSTAIFVGETERGPLAPTSIKSVGDFERAFGGHLRHGALLATQRVVLRYAIEAFFQNGGTSAYVLRVLNTGATRAARGPLLVAASPGAWASRVSAVYAPSSDGDGGRFRLYVLYRAPGGTGYSIVESWDRLSNVSSDENYMPDVLLRSQFLRASVTGAFALPPSDVGLTPTEEDVVGAAPAHLLTGAGGDGESQFDPGQYGEQMERLDEVTDAGLLVVPAPFDATETQAKVIASEALSYAEGRPRQDLFCIADLPRLAAATATDYAAAARTLMRGSDISPKTNFGAVYGPWVEVGDAVGTGRDPSLFMGPSGFVAGLYARIDQRRGVWKAPAGLEASLLGVRRPEHKLLDAHQDDLNPIGVNAIRVMPAGGNVVWGARTLQPASEWRYVPVRRTAIMLRTSIYNNIQWAVFEPNEETLWSSLRLSIGSFMDQLFRQGAFAGATAREAYFVKCDAETTPESDRVAGVVNVWVGFAPLRPAEFVVVKLSQIVNQKA